MAGVLSDNAAVRSIRGDPAGHHPDPLGVRS
jgi:hypothetical protein